MVKIFKLKNTYFLRFYLKFDEKLSKNFIND